MESANWTDLAVELGQALHARGWLAVSAESCTGGWIAEVITSVAGSSQWFERGFVTYSNAAKTDMLGVTPRCLERFGAVSVETARAMAVGALAASRGHLALAVTGIAGPGGGSVEKPVGTVCFAWATADRPVRAEAVWFPGDRGEVRRRSVAHALGGALELLADSPGVP